MDDLKDFAVGCVLFIALWLACVVVFSFGE